jgi:hypothetical protein
MERRKWETEMCGKQPLDVSQVSGWMSDLPWGKGMGKLSKRRKHMVNGSGWS